MVGDKNPVYSDHAKLLVKLYPEAKYIHLIRDPRGQIASLQRQRFGNRLIPANVSRWKRQQKQALKCSRMVDSNYVLIKYETFIIAPKDSLEKLCGFLAIPYLSEVFDYHKESEKYVAEYKGNEYTDDFRSSMEPINPLKAEEWKNTLRPNEIRIIESLCARQLKQFGYKREFAESYWPWALMIPVWIHQLIQFVISWPIRLLPYTLRMKIILRSSLFEKMYESVFVALSKKSRNQ